MASTQTWSFLRRCSAQLEEMRHTRWRAGLRDFNHPLQDASQLLVISDQLQQTLVSRTSLADAEEVFRSRVQ